MSWLAALLLAVLQGLTEFLPVSSSGHLAIFQNLLERLGEAPLPNALAFDIVLHLGTLGAVLVFFRRDILALLLLQPLPASTPPSSLTGPASAPHNGRRDLAWMVIALFPTAILGLVLRSVATPLLQRPVLVSGLIGLTGLILLSTRRRTPADVEGRAGIWWLQAVAMGAAQGLAVLPGLSRSGLTIAAGMALGMAPMTAFRWSFLLSVPAIVGASLLEIGLQPQALAGLGWVPLAAALVAGLVAFVALKLLALTLVRHRFHLFAWYCFTIAVIGAIFFSVWRA